MNLSELVLSLSSFNGRMGLLSAGGFALALFNETESHSAGIGVGFGICSLIAIGCKRYYEQ